MRKKKKKKKRKKKRNKRQLKPFFDQRDVSHNIGPDELRR